MTKNEVKVTELVWPGKYNEDGTRKEVPRVNLPFQVIETINESRAAQETRKKPEQTTLFDVYEGKEGDTFEEGWKNKLIWGDNLLVMGSLLEKFAGKVDLIYIDPPFATGVDFSFTSEIGESGEELIKQQTLIEEKAFKDTWGKGLDSYVPMMHNRLSLMKELLSPNGSIFVHCDWHVTSHLRLVLNELFGSDNFRNTIIWQYAGKGLTNVSRTLVRNYGSIHCFSKSDSFMPNLRSGVISDSVHKRWGRYMDESGRILFRTLRSSGEELELSKAESAFRRAHKREPEDDDIARDYGEGSLLRDVWTDIAIIRENKKYIEYVGYPTQKPEILLERILGIGTKSGDLVADFFCGSGTTLAVAEKLGRRWIGCDLGRWGIHVTRKRMLGIENCKPFDILNLGKYERQYWQGVTFGDTKDKPLAEQGLYEYLAFVLKLYGAKPVPGLRHLHGKKGRVMIHIGAVDAPVTIDEINMALGECRELKQKELHVLGWEWEMGLYDLMIVEAKKVGVKLLLLQIPREVMEPQAVDKDDVNFFELAYLDVQVKRPKKLTAQVKLRNFIIPNTELIPEDVRENITKWSDYIDYWAVDWDFRNDTFMQGWVSYRTQKDRTLELTSETHKYDKRGQYRILVKVIDIFGNDTSQVFEVEVNS